MKSLREFLVFDCDGFFKDKQLCYLSHAVWYEYVDGNKTDKVLGTTIELLISEDNTSYKKEGVTNVFEKIKVKLSLSCNKINSFNFKPLQPLSFKGLSGKVYGNFAEGLSLTAEEVGFAKKNKD